MFLEAKTLSVSAPSAITVIAKKVVLLAIKTTVNYVDGI
jgi:hypothetical protein